MLKERPTERSASGGSRQGPLWHAGQGLGRGALAESTDFGIENAAPDGPMVHEEALRWTVAVPVSVALAGGAVTEPRRELTFLSSETGQWECGLRPRRRQPLSRASRFVGTGDLARLKGGRSSPAC